MAEKKEKQYVGDNAQLMAEWNWEKNKEAKLDPQVLTVGSGLKAWWKCSKDHEWQATIASRNKGHGCPYCSGHKAFVGFNDLQTLNPSLAKEWNRERNKELTPADVTSNSSKRVWWKCGNGHEWQAVISSRNSGRGCPYCSGHKAVIGQNDLETINPDLASEWNYGNNSGLTPAEVLPNSNVKVWWKCGKGHEWQAAIAQRNNGSGCPYCSGLYAIKGENDLQTVNPLLAKEWNYEKNGNLRPDALSANSHKSVWWKCSEGHEWQALIANRSKGAGCPYCAGQRVLTGQNDLQTTNPTLASEWNYEKNGQLTPTNVMANSKSKVWWKCGNGHEWQATIGNRNKDRGCPYCAGKKVLRGYNDLKTLNPTLASEWNFEKNGELTPESFTANSQKKVWWKCIKGHEWQATISHRNNGEGCPVCSSEQRTSFQEYALVFYLNKYGLETIHSYREKGYELDVYIPSKKIAIEYDGYYWHKDKAEKDIEKNVKCKKDGIKLYRIREGLPPLNDSSIDYIIERYRKDFPEIIEEILSIITGTRVDIDLERDSIAIENLREYAEKKASLLYINPQLAKEWNYEKNGSLRAEHLVANSQKKVWWKCKNGHEWQAVVSSRNRGNGCPYCAGQKVVHGTNDLQTVNPVLANEWNHEKNAGLTPADVMAGSGKKAWWKCDKGHEWEATVSNRNRGAGCPYCSGRKVLQGYNDLQTINPTVVQEWDYEKNGKITPADVTANSNKKIWWKCSVGHERKTTIASRNSGCGCPQCAREKRKKR